jgi:hypothetical protein
MYRAWLAGILAGCGHEYALSSLSEALPMGSAEPSSEIAGDPADTPAAPGSHTLAMAPEELPGFEDRNDDPGEDPSDDLGDGLAPQDMPDIEITMGGGAKAAVVDYLFVVDSSSSMQRILGRVLDGFEALADSGVFPHDTRIAVMNTMPADPTHRDRLHPAAPPIDWLGYEPGFGNLIDAHRIELFREVAPVRVAERFAHDGCDAWFGPDDRNADGVPCLVANTQMALFPVGIEAGLLALHQRIQTDKPLFRTGAAVNVVVVSDTHDPGVPGDHPFFADLVARRPAFADIERSALRRQDLASFRLHAVAPAEVCAAEDWTAAGPVYFEAAHTSGGEILDVCDATPDEYIELVRKIATNGAVPQRAVIPLLSRVDIDEVLVGGQPAEFALSADGRAVLLKQGLPTQSQDVVVRFRRAAAPEGSLEATAAAE